MQPYYASCHAVLQKRRKRKPKAQEAEEEGEVDAFAEAEDELPIDIDPEEEIDLDAIMGNVFNDDFVGPEPPLPPVTVPDQRPDAAGEIALLGPEELHSHILPTQTHYSLCILETRATSCEYSASGFSWLCSGTSAVINPGLSRFYQILE